MTPAALTRRRRRISTAIESETATIPASTCSLSARRDAAVGTDEREQHVLRADVVVT
jgi:hypothetical protein